jgi:hypothetical protein
MSENRLEVHNELIAKILNRLIKNGLARIEMSSEEFLPDFAGRGIDDEDFDDHFADVLTWLQAEGFIRFEAMYGGTDGETCVSSCCLTGQALAVLDQKVEALGGITAKEAFLASEKPGSPAANYVKAGSLLGGIMGGFTKAIS